MKKKAFLLLMLLLLPILFSITIKESHAYLYNVWGVEDDESRIYELRREMRDQNGELMGVLDRVIIQYSILNISDVEYTIIVTFNSTTVYFSLNDLSTQPFTFTHIPLYDISWLFSGITSNLVFGELHDLDLLDSIRAPIPLLNNMFLLLPITYVVDGLITHGVDWATGLDEINTTVNYYTAYNHTTEVLITYNQTDVWDANFGANFNETGMIIWNFTTGWLESIVFNRTYEAPLNFSIITSVGGYTPLAPPSGIFATMSLVDLFGWIGFAVGIGGLCVTFFMFRKIRKTEDNWMD